ncbi:MAG: diguanylate cyclase [Terracidiphilus sp.]|jgi:diguanylate cyclase (GGDEF)-like protein/PAS domain S-box-containing protein
MIDRTELLEAALDSLPEGVALFGAEGEVVFWNQAAQGITGYAAMDVLAQTLPEGLEPLVEEIRNEAVPGGDMLPESRRAVVLARHKMGHGIPVIKRVLALHDGLGERIGAAALFHPAESVDALPQGENGADKGVEESRSDFEERLQMEFDDFTRGGPTFGVLWIGVDQAEELRKTHGAGACNAMLEKVRHALAQGLRPTEEMGRWSEDEFLVLAHERSAEMLAIHAQTLAGLARTADFRWWGDRISLTVSIGAAQAGGDAAETLVQLLERARQAMQMSARAGGNRAMVAAASAPTAAAEDSTCSPS